MMSDFSTYLERREQRLEAHRQAATDPAYEAQEGVRDVLAAVRSKAPFVFVSGRAGTGKSKLIDYMKTMPGGQGQVVVAPTGIAALSLKAATIHAFFKLPIGVIDSSALDEDVNLGSAARRMTRLVIDEISMVRADVLDGIDARLRRFRNDDRPFGNVQVVVVGDFLQLPPVVLEDDRLLLERLGYATPFAFSSKVMQAIPIRVATLTKVWRQTDPDMIRALGNIREGKEIQEAVSWLNERCARPHRTGCTPMLLTATRAAAEGYNQGGLAEVMNQGENSFIFEALAGGSFENEQSALPVPRVLQLAPGVRVMAVKNDPAGVYVNGSLGVVTSVDDGAGRFEDAAAEVLFDGRDDPVRVGIADWTKSRQVWDEEEEAIVETTTGFYQQLPLTIGYAITIHKSQGLSLDDVRIDLGRGAFAPGQLYVALSRAKTVEGLSLVRPIDDRDVRVDDMLVAFLDWARSAENLDFEAPPAV